MVTELEKSEGKFSTRGHCFASLIRSISYVHDFNSSARLQVLRSQSPQSCQACVAPGAVLATPQSLSGQDSACIPGMGSVSLATSRAGKSQPSKHLPRTSFCLQEWVAFVICTVQVPWAPTSRSEAGGGCRVSGAFVGHRTPGHKGPAAGDISWGEGLFARYWLLASLEAPLTPRLPAPSCLQGDPVWGPQTEHLLYERSSGGHHARHCLSESRLYLSHGICAPDSLTLVAGNSGVSLAFSNSQKTEFSLQRWPGGQPGG